MRLSPPRSYMEIQDIIELNPEFFEYATKAAHYYRSSSIRLDMNTLAISMHSLRILYNKIQSQRSLVIFLINMRLGESYMEATIFSYVFELLNFLYFIFFIHI